MNVSLGKSEPSPDPEQEKGKSEVELKDISRRKKKSGLYPPRRSQRLSLTATHDMGANVEDTIVCGNENDKTDTQLAKVSSEPDENSSENQGGPCLEEKVDYILQRLEAFEKIIETLQARVLLNKSKLKYWFFLLLFLQLYICTGYANRWMQISI